MKIKKDSFLYGTLFLWILFNTAIEDVIPGANYFDELILAYSIMLIYKRIKIITKQKSYQIVLLAIIAILLIGLISNIIWNLNNGYTVVVKDVIAFLKAPIGFVAFSNRDDSKNDKAQEIAYQLSKIILVIMFVSCIISLFCDIGMTADVRLGISSFKFVFTHPTFMVYSLVIISVVIVGHGLHKTNVFFCCINIFLLFMSLRDKAFGYIVVFIFFLVLIPNIKKIKLYHIIIAGVLAFYISKDKLMLYKTYSWSPRYGLYTTGFELLRDYFPLGSGFGTFASSLSGEYYSKVYGIYGMAGRIGVSEGDYVDLGDAGYPYYYGQFGFIGAILFCYIIVKLYHTILKLYSGSKRTAAFLMIAYLLIATLVESTLINEAGATAMIVIFIYLGKFNNVDKMKGNKNGKT